MVIWYLGGNGIIEYIDNGYRYIVTKLPCYHMYVYCINALHKRIQKNTYIIGKL